MGSESFTDSDLIADYYQQMIQTITRDEICTDEHRASVHLAAVESWCRVLLGNQSQGLGRVDDAHAVVIAPCSVKAYGRYLRC